jgi:aconitate hydratase
MLEVLSGAGALTDLIATGARLVEPDARVARGEMYPPQATGLALRTFEPEPRAQPQRGAFVVSAETLAYAVATGELGDPRNFKRPVRITVPRVLPTDDVLVARKADRSARAEPSTHVPQAFPAWKAAQTLDLVPGPALQVRPSGSRLAHGETSGQGHPAGNGHSGMAVVCGTLDEVRELAARAATIAPAVRAVLAPYIPASLVTLFSAVGIAAIRLEDAAARKLEGQKTIVLPAPSQWAEREATTVTAGGVKLPLTWLALGSERAWATGA